MTTIQEYLDRKYSALSGHEPKWEILPDEILREAGVKYQQEVRYVQGLFFIARTEPDLTAVSDWFSFFLERTNKVDIESLRRRLEEQCDPRNPFTNSKDSSLYCVLWTCPSPTILGPGHKQIALHRTLQQSRTVLISTRT
jgi:hypothetical protein